MTAGRINQVSYTHVLSLFFSASFPSPKRGREDEKTKRERKKTCIFKRTLSKELHEYVHSCFSNVENSEWTVSTPHHQKRCFVTCRLHSGHHCFHGAVPAEIQVILLFSHNQERSTSCSDDLLLHKRIWQG